MNIRKDISGKKFGYLTCLNPIKLRRSHHVVYQCICDCGKMHKVIGSNLRNGHTASCGCLKKRCLADNPKWNGVGDISAHFFSKIRANAKNKNLKFNISIEYIWNLFIRQKKKCALSGVELKFSSKCAKSDGTASLDRIDSTKGYVKKNLQWIHKDINFMKRDSQEKYFIDWCKRIANNN